MEQFRGSDVLRPTGYVHRIQELHRFRIKFEFSKRRLMNVVDGVEAFSFATLPLELLKDSPHSLVMLSADLVALQR
jgi:hypothetical protein